MPDHRLVAAPYHYTISPTLLKNGLEAVLRGGKISDLHSPLFFPKHRLLQGLFEFFYRWMHAMDGNAAAILKENASAILKNILMADEHRMRKQIDLDRGNEYDGWGKESSEQISQGMCFGIYEGQFEADDAQLMEGVTTFKMDSIGETVMFAQVENKSNPAEVRSSCILNVPLSQLKKACLRAYIDAEHDAGRIADLYDIELSQIDTEGIEFHHTRFQVPFFSELVKKGKPLNLLGAQLAETAKMGGTCFGQIMIDKPLALQLIRLGADRRSVIEHYLNTEHALNHVNIDVGGFDLRELNLRGMDLRHVEFRHAIRQVDAGPVSYASAGHKTSALIFDDNLLDALLDDDFRALIWQERAATVLLKTLPAILTSPNPFHEFRLSHFKDFAGQIDRLHQQKIVLRNLQPETIRLFNGRIYFVDRDTSGIAGNLHEVSNIVHTPYVPIHLTENAIRIASRVDSCSGDVYAYRHDQYCFFMTLMQVFYLIPEIKNGHFPDAVSAFIVRLDCNENSKNELGDFLLDPLNNGLTAPLYTYL